MTARRDARVAESGGLENRCTRKGTVGSNPTPSATCLVGRAGVLAVVLTALCQPPAYTHSVGMDPAQRKESIASSWI